MKYLSAQQKIQQLDKLASQLNKVNLYSLAASASASAFDLAKQVNDALKELLEYNYKSFSPTDTDSSTYKIISNYIEQLKKLQPKLDQDNLKVMLPMIVEIVEYFRNNLIVKSDETYATKLLSTLQQLLKTVQSMKITDPYQAFEEEEVKPLLSQVRTYIDNPLIDQNVLSLQQAINDLRKKGNIPQIPKLFTENLPPVEKTGKVDNNTIKAINMIVNSLKSKPDPVNVQISIDNTSSFPKLTNLLNSYIGNS